MAEALGQRDEIALRIDDRLLHPGRALLEQAAQQMRLAGAGIALHQQARRQQFLEIERRDAAVGAGPEIDGNLGGRRHRGAPPAVREGKIMARS